MTLYRYRACNKTGHIVQGESSAAQAAELETRLLRRGLEPLSIQPARWLMLFGPRRVPRRELIHFCFHLEQMLGAGVPVLEALADFAEGQAHANIKAIAGDLYAEVERGQPLSKAMQQHPQTFDEVFRSMLRAGESSGDLVPILRQLAADLSRADELRAQARKAAIYPVVVGIVLSAAVSVALTQVVPQIATLFRSTGQELPLSTRLLVGFSDGFRHYGGVVALAFIFLAAAVLTASKRQPRFRLWLHAVALRLPFLGPIRQRLALARAASLLGMLYASGITVIDALGSAARATPNPVIRHGIEAAGEHISAGRGIANAFESTGLFPGLVIRMLRIGEQTGRLDTSLGQLVHFYERDAREAIERLQAAIEPMMTVVMGLLMLWIAIAVLGPVYELITHLPI
ncbi:MAG: type II secretion system F family protein [Azoarcus sp.]|jgi:type IV pilus assembly protein PilC|nr:type II secretion system F family protein [Azoarcus sp.]